MKKCFDCGKELTWTGRGPGWMNSEQWEDTKAGDYFAKCDNAISLNGNCYFNETNGVNTLKRVST